MAQARRAGSRAGGPAGWVVLLGLMVLALIIAAASKGCGGSDGTTPASQSPSSTATSTAPATAQSVIGQINDLVSTAGGIAFVVGKAELTSASKTTLDSVAAILADNATVKAQVQGYTDNQGAADKNLTLSKQRADAVVTYLIGKGIDAARLSAKGFGAAHPIGDNSTEAGRAKNRRVTFVVAP